MYILGKQRDHKQKKTLTLNERKVMKLAFSTRVIRAKEQGKWKFWTLKYILYFWHAQFSAGILKLWKVGTAEMWSDLILNKNSGYFELFLMYFRIQVN